MIQQSADLSRWLTYPLLPFTIKIPASCGILQKAQLILTNLKVHPCPTIPLGCQGIVGEEYGADLQMLNGVALNARHGYCHSSCLSRLQTQEDLRRERTVSGNVPPRREVGGVKYRFGSKDKRISLGVYPGVSLRDGRRRRDEAGRHRPRRSEGRLSYASFQACR